MLRDAFDKIRVKNSDLQTYKEELIGFSNEKVHLDGFVTLHLTLGTRTIKVDFLVVNNPSAYNVILGRPILDKIKAILSIACLTMKFFMDEGEVANVKADQAADHKCYDASLVAIKKKKDDKEEAQPLSSSKVMLVDLDARWREGRRLKSDEELEVVQIEKEPDFVEVKLRSPTQVQFGPICLDSG